MKHLRVLVTVVVGLGLTLALLWMLQGLSGPVLAGSSLATTSPSLVRQHAPVIITGSLLNRLTGHSLDEIFVYAYRGTTLVQIPFQVDERDGSGKYVAIEDGQLDEDDELVFMATDAGGWTDHPLLHTGGTSIAPTHVVTITDPISGTCAWAYVFCSTALSRASTADYVSYDEGSGRITSPGWYILGFSTVHGFVDYLGLGSDSPDLLDRSKFRVTGTVWTPYGTIPFSVDEEEVTQDGIHVMDGSVRVTRVSTTTRTGPDGPVQVSAVLFAYRSLIVEPAAMAVPGAPIQDVYLRTSMDWNEHASGMTFYDANNSAGTTIDGIADAITRTPPTRWTQVAGVTGTVVNVSKIPAGLGGSQSTYFRDDSAIDSDDTGDQRSYGDAGFQVENPTPGNYTTLGHIYFLTGAMPNVGATYVNYYDHPLQVDVGIVSIRWYICLPVVMRTGPSTY